MLLRYARWSVCAGPHALTGYAIQVNQRRHAGRVRVERAPLSTAGLVVTGLVRDRWWGLRWAMARAPFPMELIP